MKPEEEVNPDPRNILFHLAADLVNQSSRNIFLTGKAGTGKTTFLKYIRKHCPKQMMVTAPTGVAAINAGGVTLHSLFQLPISPFIPQTKGFSNKDETIDKHSLLSRLHMNGDKRKLLNELELLIIDEISMVRCDILDAVDTILRHVRKRNDELFGGVQILFIGDMYQLPPVVKDHDWSILSEFYSSPYFFDSNAVKHDRLIYLEFDHIYRQSDQRFIDVLNQVRNNRLDQDGVDLLEERFQPTFRRTKDDGYIILTTHNTIAKDTNAAKLRELPGTLFTYDADVENEFPDSAFPAEQSLQLKEGAQVMFIKNDLDKGKRYFNGKIGRVIRLEDDKIFVHCEDDRDEIEVKKDRWDNIRYDLNTTTRQLEEKTLGSFSQYPLRLAWVITIHKSQGLTFDKAIIDAGKSFAAGQVYVALSRCRNLEGLVLQSGINRNSLQTDPRIVNFAQQSFSEEQLASELDLARIQYRQKLLLHIFDYSKIIAACSDLYGYVRLHLGSFSEPTADWVFAFLKQLSTLQQTAERFHQQLHRLFAANDENHLNERVKAAGNHFNNENFNLIKLTHQSPSQTDSMIHAKAYNEFLREMLSQLTMKSLFMDTGDQPFSVDRYHRVRNSYKTPQLTANSYAGTPGKPQGDIPHPALAQQLRRLRDEICSNKGLPLYMVAGTATITDMVTYLPQTIADMAKVSGFGEAKLRSYGQQFLDIIVDYSREHNLESTIDSKGKKVKEKKVREPKQPGEKPAKPGKLHTRDVTYQMFREGKSIGIIANERMLAPGTIETHLTHFILSGELGVGELITVETHKAILDAIAMLGTDSISSLKQALNDDISFGQIRFVLASINKDRASVDGPGI